MTLPTAVRAARTPPGPVRPASALIVIAGDDVYEDLFTAGRVMQDVLVAEGFAARAAAGTARMAAPLPDLVVLYTALGHFPPGCQAALAAAVHAGSGLVAVHSANVLPSPPGPDRAGDADWRLAHQLIGSRFVSHGPAPHESRFRVETDQCHPLTRGLAPFEITHEHYQIETAADADVVAWRDGPVGRQPIAYVRRVGRGRVCYLQLGHDMRAWAEPPVRALLARAARWASHPAAPPKHRPLPHQPAAAPGQQGEPR